MSLMMDAPDLDSMSLDRRCSEGSCCSDTNPHKNNKPEQQTRLAGRKAPKEIKIPSGNTVNFTLPASLNSNCQSPAARSLPTPTAHHFPIQTPAVVQTPSAAKTYQQRAALSPHAHFSATNDGDDMQTDDASYLASSMYPYDPNALMNLSPHMLHNLQQQSNIQQQQQQLNQLFSKSLVGDSVLGAVATQHSVQLQSLLQRHNCDRQQGLQDPQQQHQQQQLQQHQHMQPPAPPLMQQQQQQQQQPMAPLPPHMMTPPPMQPSSLPSPGQLHHQQHLQQHHQQQHQQQYQPLVQPTQAQLQQLQQLQQQMSPQSPPLLPNPHGLVSPTLSSSGADGKRRTKEAKKGPYATNIVTPGQVDEPTVPEASGGGPLSTDERKLVIKVESLLLDKEVNKFEGSMPVVVVQRVVTEQAKDEYEEVVNKRYNKSFHKFLSEHKKFKVFHYRQDTIDHHNLLHCTTHEGRVAFSDVNTSEITARDAETAKWKNAKWAAVLNEVEKILAVEPLQMKPLMARFKEPELLAQYGCVLPSNHSLRQLLRKQPERFVVLPDSVVKLPSQLTPEEHADWVNKLKETDGKRKKQQQEQQSQGSPASTACHYAAAASSPLANPHSPMIAGIRTDPAAAPVGQWTNQQTLSTFGTLNVGACGDINSFSPGSQRSSQGITSPQVTPVYTHMQASFNTTGFSPQVNLPLQYNGVGTQHMVSSDQGTPGMASFTTPGQHPHRLNLHESPNSAASTPGSLPVTFAAPTMASFYEFGCLPANLSALQQTGFGLGSPHVGAHQGNSFEHVKLQQDAFQHQLPFPSLPTFTHA